MRNYEEKRLFNYSKHTHTHTFIYTYINICICVRCEMILVWRRIRDLQHSFPKSVSFWENKNGFGICYDLCSR